MALTDCCDVDVDLEPLRNHPSFGFAVCIL